MKTKASSLRISHCISNFRFRPSAALAWMLLCGSSALMVSAAPPAWWYKENPPVVYSSGEQNNLGMANIGQAKWMAKQALEDLQSRCPDIAALVSADLVGEGKPIASWDAPTTPEQKAQQHQPLLLGQLKAIAAPFYAHLHAAEPGWLAEQFAANGMPDTGGPYPWTTTQSDDANTAPVTIGQLKAVFSLRFETILDRDADGLLDTWEMQHFGNLDSGPYDDPDADELTNAQEILLNTNPNTGDNPGIGQQRIINGDFTQTSVTNPAGFGPGDSEQWNHWAGIIGWQAVIGQNVELQWMSPSPNGGKYCELKAHPDGNRGIKQQIGTFNRRSYVLVFYASARADVDTGQSAFDVIISDSKQNIIAKQSITFTDRGVWRQYAISFTAIEDITNLSLVPTGPANTTGCLVDGLELSPVKIADNVNAEQTPSGVDAVSIIANTGCLGYQNKFWIMAPEGKDPSGAPCSNDVKFLIPFDPPVTLKIDPAGGNFLYEHPAGTIPPGPISLTQNSSSIVRFKGSTSASKDNIPIFKWGINEAEADIPVRVKTMKRRTVKVKAIRVHRTNAQDLRPYPTTLDWPEIQQTLNRIYGYQINAWFEVDFSDVDFDYSGVVSDGDNGKKLTMLTLVSTRDF